MHNKLSLLCIFRKYFSVVSVRLLMACGGVQTNKKVEAELRGKEYIPPSGKGKGSKSKGVVESRAASKAWKLGGVRVTEKDLEGSAQSGVGSVKAKPKKKGVRFDDVFTAQDEAETKQVCDT